ncbi:UDP-N-acetylmuramoyl-tripeptide--D-alanyl-D-alanine ligase [Corynebacterium atypicum]|uniref:UDP-N-acetylmuramoyl-tripeptide--D-alanyl-D- alanine ligase n=1 Tax=Corynebacterium atypicum TaxID=191610 RepID=UPI0005715DC4|nr:UDP-N-acetylmuramoyl-tripeptide--D-alanyl-D-alanine ligase [Corynebacterium atypicum]
MISMTLAQIAEVVGGTLADGAAPESRVTGFVEFDSRKITPGGLFVALPGERVDGHDFVAAACQAGAVAALTARPVGYPAIVVPPAGPGDATAAAFAHDSSGTTAAVVKAMAKLARHVVDQLRARGLVVVGVTGSAGKTSTKDLLNSVLSHAGETVAPPGSFNNEIGHPYTALRCTEDTKFLVAEMSARNIGHIAYLARVAPPSIGVELNVGSAHLGEFGSRENIAIAKGELVEALPPAASGGVAVLNGDDPFVAGMVERTRAKVVSFSAQHPPAPGARYVASGVALDDVARASFLLEIRDGERVLESHPVRLQVFGAHQVSNALAAAAVGIELGIPASDVAAVLSSHVTASANRMDVRTRADGVTLINDAYNANPDSMRAAVAALAFTASGRPEATSWAVLGEMAELGDDTLQAHRDLGEQLAKMHISRLVAVGESDPVGELAHAAAAAGVDTTTVPDTASAAEILQERLRGGDVVLVKASNSQGLWRVTEALGGHGERNNEDDGGLSK